MGFGRRYIALHRLRGRVLTLKHRLSRARYFRGHGVHSPFVYAIVRDVFMNPTDIGQQTTLRDALLVEGIAMRRAVELQRLMIHCGYSDYRICTGALGGCCVGEMRDVAGLWVILQGTHATDVKRMAHDAEICGATIVLMNPYAMSSWEHICRETVSAHISTSIDNRAYMLLFNNSRLPKQHFKI